jgi:hypothetical protein
VSSSDHVARKTVRRKGIGIFENLIQQFDLLLIFERRIPQMTHQVGKSVHIIDRDDSALIAHVELLGRFSVWGPVQPLFCQRSASSGIAFPTIGQSRLTEHWGIPLARLAAAKN